MGSDTAILQNEIIRLNYFIDLLIKENKELKAVLTHPEIADSIKNLVLSHPEISMSKNIALLLHPKNEDSIKTSILSHPQIVDGINNKVLLQDENSMAKNSPVLSHAEISMSKKSDSTNIPEIVNLTKEYSLQEIQQKILANAINKPGVEIHLKPSRISAKYSSLSNSVKILMQLAINPKSTGAEVRKLTGLTSGGLSKHLGVLQKTGYLTKIKYQHFLLTNLALQALGKSILN